jgi:hypothetical protein
MPGEKMTDERLSEIRWANHEYGETQQSWADELLAEIDRLRARCAALVAALPRCEHVDQCSRPAVRGSLSHVPERCDEHARPRDTRECDWAELVREEGPT